MYIAVKNDTKEVYSFKGAYKMAQFIGIHHNTIYKNAKSTLSNKIYKGFHIAKSNFNPMGNENRG